MGQSTDALLVYGYMWHDSDDADFFGDDYEPGDWINWVADREGVAHVDYSDYPDDFRMDNEERRRLQREWSEAHKQELKAFHDAIAEISQRYGGVTIDSHCSCEYPMPYVHYQPWELRAWRGSPKAIPRDFNPVGEHGVDVLLNRFMEELGIQYPDGQDSPQWWMASMWC